MAPEDRPKRPLSVVLLQVVLATLFATYVAVFARTLGRLASPAVRARIELLPFLAALSIRLIPPLIMAYVFWALVKRKPHGRWLGLLCILALLAGGIYQAIHSGSHPFVPGPKSARQIGEMFGELSAPFLIAWWFYSFGFSRAAKAFFAGARSLDSGVQVEPREG